MYKNILVISDNLYLTGKFIEIIKDKKFDNCTFTFSISPFSNKENFLSLCSEIKIFDLKNTEDIICIKEGYDLVFSIHCKQIFPIELISYVKCINIHPGYNPINRGWYPQVFSIINKTPIGATIHEIDEYLDHGAIIARELVSKSNSDTSESLYNKIVEKEVELLEDNLEKIISNDYLVIKPEVEGNLYLKKDFTNLLELNLNEEILAGDFIDRLRALTHGNFNNAYFIDRDSGNKVFVSINLKTEKDE